MEASTTVHKMLTGNKIFVPNYQRDLMNKVISKATDYINNTNVRDRRRVR